MTRSVDTAPLTGRLASTPSALLRKEILDPQFAYEVEHLLPYYLQAEQALTSEYQRMGLLDAEQALGVASVLGQLTAGELRADPAANLSDIAFAVERHVSERLTVPIWHVDRSRNDLQACAQLMFGRHQALLLISDLLLVAASAQRLARRYLDDVMPGYTHLQAAQVITPGFHASAISAYLLHTVRRLLNTYDGWNLCPLGSGALAGQELTWDRPRLASLLGFAGPQPHALLSVASRAWLVELAAECSTFAVGISRPVTDLMIWAGSEHGFLELPDELAGISSAMPQKKNYPILERIRGRTAHATAWYLDVAMTQRNTPFSNTVEVSKESSAQLSQAIESLRSALRLLTEVLDRVSFNTEHLRQRCVDEYLGAFSLANRLALDQQVPWRQAQVIAGQYVVAASAAGLHADNVDGQLLSEVASQHGYPISDAEHLLRLSFNPDAELQRRRSAGSAHPDEVSRLLADQERDQSDLAAQHAARQATLDAVPERLTRLFAGSDRRP